MQPIDVAHHRTHHRRQSRRIYTTHFFHAALYSLLAACSLLTGIWLSLYTGDWQWFARSGSLLVILGIMLTSHQIIENNRRLKLRRAQHDSNFKHDFAEDYDSHRLAHASVVEEDIWHDGLRGLYLLVSGTLIWGFGDLLGWFI